VKSEEFFRQSYPQDGNFRLRLFTEVDVTFKATITKGFQFSLAPEVVAGADT
jgi:hypothetical protein